MESRDRSFKMGFKVALYLTCFMVADFEGIPVMYARILTGIWLVAFADVVAVMYFLVQLACTIVKV
jgi:hypothetical protein